jgi:hypothetical protein
MAKPMGAMGGGQPLMGQPPAPLAEWGRYSLVRLMRAALEAAGESVEVCTSSFSPLTAGYLHNALCSLAVSTSLHEKPL